MKTISFKGNFIDGRFVLPSSGAPTLVSEDPGDLLNPLGEFSFSKSAVDPAVQSARSAFDAWSSKRQNERAHYLIRFKQLLKQKKSELARLITREMGKALSESQAEVDRLADKVDRTVREESLLIRSSHHRLPDGLLGRLQFRPRGVLAILAPFNLPAYLPMAQALPALLSGNTVIHKPSELTPFVGQFLADLWKESRLTKGVYNLVQGDGQVGSALAGHPKIDGVLFTGSWDTGSKIQAALADQPHKMCALEMGGKNAAIVLKDCDFGNALDGTFLGGFLTTGQRCNATSRIIVEKQIAQKFVEQLLKKVDSIQIGYGFDAGVFMGPVVSRKAVERVDSYLRLAHSEGFETLRAGGPADSEREGYYLKPSVHLKEGLPQCSPKDGTYTDDEIFGPDITIYIVRNLDEAVQLNNRSHYGLVVSVFTKSKKSFERVRREAQDGLINWNVGTTRSSGRLPFGGLKRSGNDRPVGFFSPYLCTIPTAVLEQGAR